MYSTFSTLWGRPDIWVRMDRYGVMRPTILKTSKTQQKDGKTETIETIEKKDEWKTNGHWLHWDQNPFTEPNFVRMQGHLTLSSLSLFMYCRLGLIGLVFFFHLQV